MAKSSHTAFDLHFLKKINKNKFEALLNLSCWPKLRIFFCFLSELRSI